MADITSDSFVALETEGQGDRHQLLTGIPRGSVFGPLLFYLVFQFYKALGVFTDSLSWVPQSCQHLWKIEPTEDAEAVMHDLVFLRDKWVYRKVKWQLRSIAVIRFMNCEGKYKERVQRRHSVLYVRMTERNRAVGPTAKSQKENSHWLASITAE